MKTHTYLFLQDVLRQSTNGAAPPGWPTSWGANTRDYGMDPDIVNSPTYRDQLIPALKSLPSFSVVTDLKHLFDPTTGIYANPGQDGRDWERPCSLELVFPDGSKGFQIDAGIRIRGGFSRSTGNPKHALRFFFRESYGASKLKFPLFGNAGTDEFDALDLRTFQNYSWSFQGDSQGVFIRDQFSRDTQLDMGRQGSAGTTTTCTSMASTGGSSTVVSDPKRPTRPPTMAATRRTTMSLRWRQGRTPSTPRMATWRPGPGFTMLPRRASRTMRPTSNSKAATPMERPIPLTRTCSM